MSTQFSKVYACYVWKQWNIWLQNYKMDTKKKKTVQCMWILNTIDAWKDRLAKHLKIEKFSISIDRASIEYQFQGIFDRSKNRFDWSKFWKIEFFLKNSKRFCRNHSNQVISWMKCMRMSLKVFQKHEFSTQNFKTKISNS